jgi:hypothetical protein
LLSFVIFLTFTSLASGCALIVAEKTPEPSAIASTSVDQGLLTAYFLLADTLSQESKLGALAFLKKITLRRPVPELDEVMSRLSDTSSKRLDELESLRTLPPDVSADPTHMDPIGEAITTSATESGMNEMLDRNGSFGIRFVFLQAQATRMIAAISQSAAAIESNQRRKKWLTDLADEYESIRDDLVVIVEKYVMQEGAAQQE